MMLDPLNDLKGIKFDCDEDGSNEVKTGVFTPMVLRKLKQLQEFFVAKDIEPVSEWFTYSQNDFKEWTKGILKKRLIPNANTPETPAARVHFQSPISPIPTPGSASQFSGTSSKTTAAEFHKSVKKSVDDYQSLTKDANWKTWKRLLHATAANHGLSNVLNPDYVPTTDEELELFNAHNKFMFLVFMNHLKTAKASVAVRRHELNQDAQKVYADLLKSYENDIAGNIQAHALRTEIINMRLDSNWRGCYETFLHKWTNKILELENLENSSIPSKDKRTWLETTLSTNTDMSKTFADVVTQEGANAILNGGQNPRLDFEDLFALLKQRTIMLDNYQKRSDVTQHRRTNNTHVKRDQKNSGNTNTQVKKDKTKWTGPDMKMEAHMSFSDHDWYNNVTKKQKEELNKLRGKFKSSNNKNNSTTNPTSSNRNGQSGSPKKTPRSVYSLEQAHQQEETENTNKIGDLRDETTSEEPLPGIRSILSNRLARKSPEQSQSQENCAPEEIFAHGRRYKQFQVRRTTYSIKNLDLNVQHAGSLIDGGANGGMSGTDVRFMYSTFGQADITGVGENTITNLPIGTVASLIETTSGPIIGFFHQYAHLGKGRTVHAANQLRHFGVKVYDESKKTGGKQMIFHPDGYTIPLHIRDGLAYMDMYPPSDEELDKYPHVFFTADAPWDPKCLDCENNLEDADRECAEEPDWIDGNIDDSGYLIFSNSIIHHQYTEPADEFEEFVDHCSLEIHQHKVNTKSPNLDNLGPNFGFVPRE